jgi:hypothetical protein
MKDIPIFLSSIFLSFCLLVCIPFRTSDAGGGISGRIDPVDIPISFFDLVVSRKEDYHAPITSLWKAT